MSRLLLLAAFLLTACAPEPSPDKGQAITVEDIAAAEDLIGVPMTSEEREQMLPDVRDQRAAFDALHQLDLPNALAPTLVFDPGYPLPPPAKPRWSKAADVARPANDAALPFLSVAELGALLRSGKLSSVELTQACLARIRQFDPELHAIITLTDALALEQAARADAELAAGTDRGPLHGIPYGLKDLAAVAGYPTTWGATPYKEQVIGTTATVARRMEEAGAVLIGKTSVGALAWGDVWFDAMTRTPWNRELGSSGSSAGSAAGVAAGFFPVAIGTETWGSVISPSVRTGVIGLRPTYGRVSRAGFMALSWSMDKVGAICRHVEDCGMVLDAMRGADPADASTRDAGFAYLPERSLRDLRLGYLAADFVADDYGQREADSRVIAQLQAVGVEPLAVKLPDLPIESMAFVLSAEAGAAFDTLTRSGQDDTMVRQSRDAWPNVFRAARFIPAVEYLQANRLRERLVQGMQQMFAEAQLDVILAPCFSGNQLLATNLSGHPSMVLPTGLDKDGMPIGFCLLARPFHEEDLLTAAKGLQEITGETVRIAPAVR